MQHQPFTIEQRYRAPVKKVWEALTDKSKMKDWYFDIPDFKPETGTEFRFNGGTETKTYVHICKVTEVVPGKKLSHTWRYDGYEGDSLVRFELSEEGDTTLLKLTHSGLESFPADNPDFKKDNFVKGWTELVGNLLLNYVETADINKTVMVDASADKIWSLITDHVKLREWASAFGEGTCVETDWKEGSVVDWKDAEGNIGARGIVAINKANRELKICYYDDTSAMPPAQTGEYIERFILTPADGKTELTIEAGPIAKKHYEMHEPMWTKALANIKTMAENS